MALFFLPTAAAVSPTLVGQITFATAEISGNITSGENAHSLLFLPPGVLKAGDFTIMASRLTVNWTDVGRYDVMDPRNLSRPQNGVQSGPAVQGEREHRDATAIGTVVGESSNVLVSGIGEDVLTSQFSARGANITANPLREWVGGSRMNETTGQPDPNGTIVRMALPTGLSQTQLQQAEIRVTGNLTIQVWESSLTVTDGNDTTTYHAGWQSASSSSLPLSPVQERQSRLLTLRATNADMTIRIETGHALLAALSSRLAVAGQARLTSALGVIEGQSIFDESLSFDGEFQLDSQNASTRENRMRGNVLFSQETTVLAGANRIARTGAPGQLLAPWWIAAGLVPVLLVGTVVSIRRYGPVTLDDVEYAILSGHDRRAHRSARRLVHKTPRDPDAVFLYATTLLQRKDFQPLLEKIEPLAAKIPKPERRGIAFVLAVASHALGDKLRSAKWGAEAAREPLLAQKLEESGVGAFKPGPSRFTQSGYA